MIELHPVVLLSDEQRVSAVSSADAIEIPSPRAPLTLVFEQPLFKFAASVSAVEMNNSARLQSVSICGTATGG
jgi:hypothetical protein